MIRAAFRFRYSFFAACMGLLLATDRAAACSVCFGDPESPMAKGAIAGVLVLIGVVGFVLLGVAGTSLFWVQRSRRLAGVQDPLCPFDDCHAVQGP